MAIHVHESNVDLDGSGAGTVEAGLPPCRLAGWLVEGDTDGSISLDSLGRQVATGSYSDGVFTPTNASYVSWPVAGPTTIELSGGSADARDVEVTLFFEI